MTIEYKGFDLQVILGVSCPRCGAKKRWACTYVETRSWKGSLPDPKVGFATKQPHWERRDKYREKDRREKRQAYLDQLSAEETARREKLRGHYEALMALRTFDQIEYQRLRSWLQTNIQIFFHEGWGTVNVVDVSFGTFPEGWTKVHSVQGVDVLPRHRSQGIGTQLMKEALADADEEGVTLILDVTHVTEEHRGGLTHDQLWKWYSKMGFEPHQILAPDGMVRHPIQENA